MLQGIPRRGSTRALAQQIAVLVPRPPLRAKQEPQVKRRRLAKVVIWLNRRKMCHMGTSCSPGAKDADPRDANWGSAETVQDSPAKNIPLLTTQQQFVTFLHGNCARAQPQPGRSAYRYRTFCAGMPSQSPAKEHKRTVQKYNPSKIEPSCRSASNESSSVTR